MAKERKSIVCLAAVNVTAIIIAVLVLSFASMPLKAFCSEPCSFVDPFIGTSATGHTFPAACVPFGLVQAGPDTVGREDLWWHYCSGYRFEDESIIGFSQTHLNGTGGIDLGDLLILHRNAFSACDSGLVFERSWRG